MLPTLHLPGIKALLSAAGQRPTAPSGGRYCTVSLQNNCGRR